MGTPPPSPSALATLRGMARQRELGETCDLCSEPIPDQHRHLLQLSSERVVCSCQPCSILFADREAKHYRLIPSGVRFVPDFEMSDEIWASFGVPVSMAFFQHSHPSGQVAAVYPSPAGATRSLLTFDAWEELEEANPVLRGMQPAVEALLVNRVGGARDHYLASIDECYRLVGLIRMGWRGLSGGTEVWRMITGFFGDLDKRAETVSARDA
ncbi:MAG: DUF5947 family protein [Candidatus Dormibacteraeota bacterium]|nr:DUF5947 family protein [Candidatus Dormibacteraeota bacterium]